MVVLDKMEAYPTEALEQPQVKIIYNSDMFREAIPIIVQFRYAVAEFLHEHKCWIWYYLCVACCSGIVICESW